LIPLLRRWTRLVPSTGPHQSPRHGRSYPAAAIPHLFSRGDWRSIRRSGHVPAFGWTAGRQGDHYGSRAAAGYQASSVGGSAGLQTALCPEVPRDVVQGRRVHRDLGDIDLDRLYRPGRRLAWARRRHRRPRAQHLRGTNAASRNLVRSWIQELKGRNIRLNAVSPASVETPGLVSLAADQIVDDFLAQLAAQMPGGRNSAAAATSKLA